MSCLVFKIWCIFNNFRNENFKNFPYPLDFARSAKLPLPPPPPPKKNFFLPSCGTAVPQTHRRQAPSSSQTCRRPAADYWEITFILSVPSRRQLFTSKYTSQTSCRHAFRRSGDGDRSGELNPIQLLRFDTDSASESATYLRCVCDICSHMPEGIGDHLADTSQA